LPAAAAADPDHPGTAAGPVQVPFQPEISLTTTPSQRQMGPCVLISA